jgi:hypothetical protein
MSLEQSSDVGLLPDADAARRTVIANVDAEKEAGLP